LALEREIRGAKGIAGDLFRDADFKGLISQKAVSEECPEVSPFRAADDMAVA
jgi:hypothetical protein